MFRFVMRMLPVAGTQWAFSQSKQELVDYMARNFDERIERMKKKLGTQMMTYPDVTFRVKGGRFSASFTIDERRKTLPDVFSHLESLPSAVLIRREKQRVHGVDCHTFTFQDAKGEFTVTVSGPNSGHFYTFDLAGDRDLSQDFDRLESLYQKANKPKDEVVESRRRANRGMAPAHGSRKQRKDPMEELTELGAKVYMPSAEADLDWGYLAGYEEAKRDIEDTIMLALEHPEIYDRITETTRYKAESNYPRAVLFEGPPGTGKTTSAKIIAQQVKIPMVYVPLEAVISKWYGEAEKNLGKIFDSCRELGKCIIFIDEIDSLAQSRDKDMHEATRRMLSVFLRYLDGFDTADNVLVVCATNRKSDLDAALQSRFSKVIAFPIPDEFSRAAIFRRYARHLTEAQLFLLAKESDGLAGRDIKSVCEDAERRWAARMLRGEVSDTRVEFDLYTHALRARKSGRS